MTDDPSLKKKMKDKASSLKDDFTDAGKDAAEKLPKGEEAVKAGETAKGLYDKFSHAKEKKEEFEESFSEAGDKLKETKEKAKERASEAKEELQRQGKNMKEELQDNALTNASGGSSSDGIKKAADIKGYANVKGASSIKGASYIKKP